jgi:hypothetical protein
MLDKKLLIVTCAGVLVCAAAALAQTPAPQPPQSTTTAASPSLTPVPEGGEVRYLRPETPEQRKKRLGTAEDPGSDPDPSKHFWRYGHSSHIEKFDRRWENYEGCEPGFVRPFGFVNLQREIYQLNDKWVWVWMPDRDPEEPQAPPAPESRYNDEQLNYLQNLRSEFSELTPKPSAKTIEFAEASSGLPTSGSWRNSLATADMNGDGCPDIIAPPERKGVGAPAIFLGDCKGQWKFWSGVKWPRGVDYGSVVAADFNKDGHMDLAFGVHLRGIFVMLGDGKGNFKEVTQGLPRDFATRRVVIADVDHDGYPDLVGIAEGPAATIAEATPRGKVRVYFNRKKGTSWEQADVSAPDKQTAGDWLTVADLTGDKRPDMIAANIYMNSNDTIYVSDGPRKWRSIGDPYLVPFLSVYYANAAGKFSSKKYDDAIVSYTRAWPADVPTMIVPDPPSKAIVGIDRITIAGKTPKRTPIARWSSTRGVTGVAAGDFDDDGNLDLVYTKFDPREAVILLGDGQGGFTRANVAGLKLDPNPNYDIHVADVNGDGKPDVIVMYESTASTVLAEQTGSIHVFLNRGAPAAAAQAKK